MEKGPILILTGDYGSGHIQAAHALRRALAALHPEIKAEIMDYMAEAHPRVHPISKYVYLNGVQTFPKTYGYFYGKTRHHNRLTSSLKFMQALGLGKFLTMLQTIKPSVVVSTFPLAAGAMSFMKDNGLYEVPTVTVITDFTDHSYWLYPETDYYVVGSIEVAHSLSRVGVEPERISVTGIPIRPEYNGAYDKTAILTEIGLDPERPTVLVMGGGNGLMGQEIGEALCLSLARKELHAQMIFVCGHNDKLRLHLTRLKFAHKLPIVVTGFTDRVPELMAASDLLLTKSGGLTSSEALAVGLPMLIYKPLPGQEIDNANFLRNSGAAIHIEDEADLLSTMRMLLKSPARLDMMRRQAKKVSKPYSAEAAAGLVAELIAQSNKQTV
ncbi:MGDG synthase family glycosyltransferase [Paenibacillus lignilyticus]|uniref:1,2-diacylglycerol 3-glucosyltransferase n=1 Tax=Paenibacillus lignilyticus TaxID=1172615 RepID=A0ABS5CBC5_9BACL|nr:glycosyltransferase [Paenibacillus lignilyticus]MBP3963265.1 1,2-diacylglycerol 3-glucosyltransferase [Paenibacillus lignilyticus]